MFSLVQTCMITAQAYAASNRGSCQGVIGPQETPGTASNDRGTVFFRNFCQLSLTVANRKLTVNKRVRCSDNSQDQLGTLLTENAERRPWIIKNQGFNNQNPSAIHSRSIRIPRGVKPGLMSSSAGFLFCALPAGGSASIFICQNGRMSESTTTRPSQFRAWLQLMRIANLPTAISNVLAGALLSKNLWRDVPLGHLIVASALMYCGGMILNDAFDANDDAIKKPDRPIPSKTVSRKAAFIAGLAMLVLGIIAVSTGPISIVRGGISGGLDPNITAIWTITLMLPAMILMYNGLLKKTWFAPILMGGCRTLNILLGATGGFIYHSYGDRFNFNPRLLWYAFAVGTYVTGITLLARRETDSSFSRFSLGASATVIILGLFAVAITGWLPLHSSSQFVAYPEVQQAFAVFIALTVAPVVRRLAIAIKSTSPDDVGRAIVTSLTSIIFLDAAVCFLVRPDQLFYAASVALLIVPVILLRRFSAQT